MTLITVHDSVQWGKKSQSISDNCEWFPLVSPLKTLHSHVHTVLYLKHDISTSEKSWTFFDLIKLCESLSQALALICHAVLSLNTSEWCRSYVLYVEETNVTHKNLGNYRPRQWVHFRHMNMLTVICPLNRKSFIDGCHRTALTKWLIWNDRIMKSSLKSVYCLWCVIDIYEAILISSKLCKSQRLLHV